MSVLLFRLRSVPDDEAAEIRDLLTQNSIDYYETPGGNWGISMAAIWLKDESQLQEARSLIEAYQQERFARVRGEHERLRREGKKRTLMDEIKENPLQVIFYLAITAGLIYIFTKPFFAIGK